VKRIHIAAVVVCALIWTACDSAVQTSGQNGSAAGDDSPIGRAFKNGTSNVQVDQQQKIKPLIAQRFPLAEARRAQELLGKGGVIGKIVLVRNGSSLESGAT
jgi:NADPH:quinone reductase-like Zn-dependent oxidoreductase